MDSIEWPGPVNIGALILRLDQARRNKELSPADKIIEFDALLTGARKLYLDDFVEQKQRYVRIHALVEELLSVVKDYKDTLSNPNAPTRTRILSMRRFDDIIALLRTELRENKGTDDDSI